MRPTAVLLLLFPLAILSAQAARPKDVRDAAKGGAEAMPKLEVFLKDPSREVRLEAVKQIASIGTQASLNPLIQATRDNDPEIQTLAANGLVNFYYPGYVQFGLRGALKRVSSGVKSVFADPAEEVIEPFVSVRPEVVEALGRLVAGASTVQGRANAARAVGVLRGKSALPQLIEGVHSKDSDLIYESLIAIQKTREASAGPDVAFRLRDLELKVQIAAIEAAGLLQNREAVPTLADILRRSEDTGVRRAALTAIAMMPSADSRQLFAQYLNDKDEGLRGAAAEGYARQRDPNDLPVLRKAWEGENKTSPRVSLAFALVTLGTTELSQSSPLQFLIDTLNSAAYNGEAFAFLAELARTDSVRALLYGPIAGGTKAEKIGLARVLAYSGDKDSVAPLEKLSRDNNADVAQEGLRALRSLQARL